LLLLMMNTLLPTVSFAAAAEVQKEVRADGVVVETELDAKGVRHGKYIETNADGKVLLRGKYKDGERDGTWTHYLPNGHTIESEEFRRDKRNGKRICNYDNGNPLSIITYAEGEIAAPFPVFDTHKQPLRMLRYPRRPSQVSAILKKWWPDKPIAPVFAQPPVTKPPYAPGRMEALPLKQTLQMVQAYRALSGAAADDLVFDDGFNRDAQHGAVLLFRLGQLTHDPTRPNDMDQAFFDIGYQGCHTSNICSGQAVLDQCIQCWMDDSDPGNINQLGHRRWILSPPLQRLGFGYAEGYALLHVVGGAGGRMQPWDLIAFPGEGAYPANFLKPHLAWSVLLSPEVYHKQNGTKVGVAIFPLDDRFQAGEPLPCNIINVDEKDGELFIIFKPDEKAYAPGIYWVRLDGLILNKPVTKEVGYLVDLQNFTENKASGGDNTGGQVKKGGPRP
jgi:hypothetical protein